MNILMKLSSAIESANEVEKESTSALSIFGKGIRGIDCSNSRTAPFHHAYLQREARARLLMN